MERRSSDRIPFRLNAEIKSGGKTYAGLIENVSEGGIEYLMTSMIEVSKDFIPERLIEVNFKIPSDELISLSCIVEWFLKSESGDGNLVLGMRIINPPSAYKEWINKLYIDCGGD